MAEYNPFNIKVYTKDFAFKGFANDVQILVATPRHNQTPTASFTLDADHRQVPNLLADGARVVIELRGEFLLSGKVSLSRAEGPNVQATLTFQVRGDFRFLHDSLGWPRPEQPITNQTAPTDTRFGNAEDVAKAFIQANMVQRLGRPVTVTAPLGRGAVIPDGVSTRFHTLYEKLFPAVETAGLGISFKQQGATIVCDVYTQPVYPVDLSETSGVITSWSWSAAEATATRVVAGGGGEDEARMFRVKVDTPLETATGDIVEVFRDARDADTEAVLLSRAQETLDESGPKFGFSIQLSETDNFQYGKNGLVVGALVTIRMGSVTRTDVLREVTLSYTAEDGVKVTPTVGDIQDSPDKTIAQFMAKLKKAVTDLRVSK